jgi:diketogulonate reductase-like aldo/keto reductase
MTLTEAKQQKAPNTIGICNWGSASLEHLIEIARMSTLMVGTQQVKENK